MRIQISRKSANLTHRSWFYLKGTNKENSELFKVNFLPESNMQNSAYTKPFNLEL